MFRPLGAVAVPQLQALLGEGHVNIVTAKAVMLTGKHVALAMEFAAGGNMTHYVAKKWQHGPPDKLFLSEDEARYYFRVRSVNHTLSVSAVFTLC